jgi:hypothetical protein
MTTESALSLDTECFFIAPIGKEGSSERKRSDGVLKFVVARAADELGLVAVRADQISEPGQITLQVIDHILGARGAVADLTGLNPNVFYELAVRHTARLPIALIAEKDCSLPFDIAQMRTIFFDSTDLASADNCRRDIVTHLREAFDKKAVDSPIATSVDVRALQGGNQVERNIAELVTSVEDIAKHQRQTMSRVERLTRILEDLLTTENLGLPMNIIADLDHTSAVFRAIAAKEEGNAELRKEVERLEDMVRWLSRHRRIPRLRSGGRYRRTEDGGQVVMQQEPLNTDDAKSPED